MRPLAVVSKPPLPAQTHTSTVVLPRAEAAASESHVDVRLLLFTLRLGPPETSLPPPHSRGPSLALARAAHPSFLLLTSRRVVSTTSPLPHYISVALDCSHVAC